MPADPPLLVIGDYGVEVELAVSPGATNVEIDVGVITFAKIASFIMNADKGALSVYTNATDGTGGQHFALAANNSLSWNNTQTTFANPITANITKFFLNNAGSVIATFRAGFALNS
jgi:hypothetical protein